MILLSARSGSGINPFFPLFVTEKYRNISVLEWNQYRRLLPLFILANSICALAFALFAANPVEPGIHAANTIANVAVFAYIFARLRFGRRTIIVDTRPGLDKRVAPFVVWLDYISLGAMFFLLASVGAMRTESDFMRMFFSAMKLFFLVYSFLPLLNYMKYRSK
jgi:hypothetical protein